MQANLQDIVQQNEKERKILQHMFYVEILTRVEEEKCIPVDLQDISIECPLGVYWPSNERFVVMLGVARKKIYKLN